MITYKLKIGKGMLEFQAQTMKDIHKFGAVYSALPEICDNCQSDNIHLSFKSPSGNDYYTIKCKACGAELALHQYKDGGFYVVAGEKMTVYVKPEDNQPVGSNAQKLNDTFNKPNSDDNIPF